MPGLSQGAISLATSATASGQGTVTVEITSLSNPDESVTTTATLNISATAGTLTLLNNSGLSSAERSSATISQTALQVSDSDATILPASIVYTLTTAPTQGTLLLAGQALANGGTFTQDDINQGRLSFSAVEEGSDSFAFSVAASDGPAVTGAFTISISDPSVVATGGLTFTATAGSASASSTVATFVDPGGAEALADYSAAIAWGDGATSAGAINEAGGTFTVSGSHNYASAGTESVAVTVTHENSTTTTATSTAIASGASTQSISGVGVAVNGFELSPLSGAAVATFTLSGNSAPASPSSSTQFSATINWGDRATSAGGIALAGGTYTVSGSHTYADEHVYPVSVAISGAGLVANVSTQATVLEELLPNGTRGTANQRYVLEIYRDVLHRAAEQGGLDYWTAKLDAGESHGQLAYEIVQLALPREEQRDEVQALYETYLHRAPDPGGLEAWTTFLFNGGTDEELAQILVSSPEYLQSHGSGANDGFLDALYQDALGRTVDASGRAFYDKAMAKGATPASVAAIIFGSDEYRRNLVSGFYQAFLDRPLDPVGMETFVDQLAAGQRDEQIIAEMVASDEFFAKTAE